MVNMTRTPADMLDPAQATRAECRLREEMCIRDSMDGAVRAGWPYDAVRYYLESGRTSVRAGRVHWPINVLDPHPTPCLLYTSRCV